MSKCQREEKETNGQSSIKLATVRSGREVANAVGVIIVPLT